MKHTQTTSLSPALSVLALALLVVGLIEAVAVGWIVARDGVAATGTIVGAPQLLWALWAAVVLTVLSNAIHQGVRYAVALGALLVGSFRAGVHVLVLAEMLPAADPVLVVLRSVPALLAPLILALWAVIDALRRRPAPSAVTRPVRAEVSVPLRVPPMRAVVPSSPTTPISRGPHPGAGVTRNAEPVWNRVSSPWPRAVEDDPDGTLVRPPRRRAAL